MDPTAARLTALADHDRWRIVALLAERPRSVGVVAQLTGLRQPQASKHLQRLEKAGLVVSQRSGQRRIYALEAEPLRELATLIGGLAEKVEQNRGDRETFDRYAMSMAAEILAADRERWADDRVFTFHRVLAAPRDRVWRHLTDPDLAAAWWSPRGMVVSELDFEPRPGGRVVQEYRDADDGAGTDGIVGRAEGVVDVSVEPERLAFRLSPFLPDGSVAFTGHYELTLRDQGPGSTALDVRLRIADSAIASADFIAGIELGWSQCLDHLADAVAVSEATTHTKEQE